jgi:hypothetical protein
MNAAARSLEVLTAPPSVPWSDWALQANADYVANTQAQALAGLPTDSANGLVNMPEVVAALQRHLPADAVLTNGAGNFASWVHRYYKHHGLSKGHKTQLAPTVGAMGYGVPAGVAASVLTGRVAFTIAGDGDFLMNGQELATATQHGAKSIVVLLNNGMYGTIRMHQERDFPTHNMGSNLNNPHFANLAKDKSLDNSKQNGGSLGWLLPNQLIPPLANVVVNLNKGAVSAAPIATSVGWQLIKLEDKRKFQPPTFEESKPLLLRSLQANQQNEYVQKLVKAAKVEDK